MRGPRPSLRANTNSLYSQILLFISKLPPYVGSPELDIFELKSTALVPETELNSLSGQSNRCHPSVGEEFADACIMARFQDFIAKNRGSTGANLYGCDDIAQGTPSAFSSISRGKRIKDYIWGAEDILCR